MLMQVAAPTPGQEMYWLLGLMATAVVALFWQLLKSKDEQIATIQGEKKALLADVRDQAALISKLGSSMDKLTDQGVLTVRLLEDVVYGRQEAQKQRHTT